jgi:hypothetical protein
MNHRNSFSSAILVTRHSIGRFLERRGFLPIVLALVLFTFAPRLQAVTPPPDGGYPNNNTAEGTNALESLTTGTDNTAIGFQALFNNTDARFNTAIGSQALFHVTTGAFGSSGSFNTANGYQALFSNTEGGDNTAIGSGALRSNTTGNHNTAIGQAALLSNKTATDNTAVGRAALANSTGRHNTATGSAALRLTISGSFNTATGSGALDGNINGNNNTATGFNALCSDCLGEAFVSGNNNTATGANALIASGTGNNNTATGFNALLGCNGCDSPSIGDNNTATGANALFSCNTGNNNTGGGFRALFNNVAGSNNTAEGFGALANSTGSNNTALGSNAGINLRTGENNVYIDAQGLSVESETIRIGRRGVQKAAYVQGISGATVSAGLTVIIGSNGHLGTIQSSARYKDEIKPMDKASEAILALKPVTFRYKKELDPDRIPQFGLVAEEVEKVNPDLVARDEDGKVMTVRYEAVNAMLLNEFLKEHRIVEEQGRKFEEQRATIAELKSRADNQREINMKQGAIIAQQQKQIEALTAGLQKVTARVEAANSVPRVVSDN